MLNPQPRVVIVPLIRLQGVVAPAALDPSSSECFRVFVFLEVPFSLIVVLALFALCDRFFAFGAAGASFGWDVAWTARRTLYAVCGGWGRWRWIGDPIRAAFADPRMVIEEATDRAPVSSNPIDDNDRASGPDTVYCAGLVGRLFYGV
jgi:hypothetical protein